MGVLTCSRCGATAEGKNFEEADAKIDHAIGLSKGFPCSGDEKFLKFDEKKSIPKPEPGIAETEKLKKEKEKSKK